MSNDSRSRGAHARSLERAPLPPRALAAEASATAKVENASAGTAAANSAAAGAAAAANGAAANGAAAATRARADSSVADDKSSMMTSPCEVAFFHMLRVELKKASEFYENTVQQMELRRKGLLEGVRLLRAGPTIKASRDARSHAFIVAACIKFYKELVLLENFCIMCAWRARAARAGRQRRARSLAASSRARSPPLVSSRARVLRTYCGFSKILKKHDKMTGHRTREHFMQRCVNGQPFTQHERTIALIKEVEAVYAELPAMLVEATAPLLDADGSDEGAATPQAAAPPATAAQYDASLAASQELARASERAAEVRAADGAPEGLLARAASARGAVGLKPPLHSPRPSEGGATGERGAAGADDGRAAAAGSGASVVAHEPPPQSPRDMIIIDAIIRLKDQNARMMQEESDEMQTGGPIGAPGGARSRAGSTAEPIGNEDGWRGESPPDGDVIGKKRKGESSRARACCDSPDPC